MEDQKLKFGDPHSIAIRDRGYIKGDGSVPPPNRTTSFWRLKSREVIHNVLVENPGADKAALKSALHDKYPFGMRKYTPYKLWLQEVKAALAGRR